MGVGKRNKTGDIFRVVTVHDLHFLIICIYSYQLGELT